MSWICSHCGEKFSHARARCPADGSRVVEDLDGRTFGGRYTVRELIGVGGMDSTVWKAWQTGTERAVAIKVLPPAEDAAAKRFGRGARIAANLTHPNCLVIHDYGTSEDGHLYLVMELLKGKPLQELLSGPTPGSPVATSVADAVDIADQVLQALEHAHASRAVHRDLKPDNLFVMKRADGSLHVKILDFGIAKYIEEDPTDPSAEDDATGDGLEDLVTEQRQVCGTPQYMAPEQVVGARVDARTDLYSLGVVLYRMLTGRLPFDGKTRFELYQKHLQEPPPPFRTAARPGLEFPPRLELIVMRALAKNPNQRFQSASEMRKALAEVEVGASARPRTGTSSRVGGMKNTSPQHTRPVATARPAAPPPLDPPDAPWRSHTTQSRGSEKKGLTLELGAVAQDDFVPRTLVLPDAPIRPRRQTVSVQSPLPAPAQTEPSSSEQAAPADTAPRGRPRRALVAAVLIGAFLIGVGGVAGIMALVRGERAPTTDVAREVTTAPRAPERADLAQRPETAPSAVVDPFVPAPTVIPAVIPAVIDDGSTPTGPTGPTDPTAPPPDPAETAPEPAIETFEFQLDSVPRGAQVTVGDRDFGVTPATLDLPWGDHTLQLNLDGHVPESVAVRLAGDVAPTALRRTVYLARRVDAAPTPRPPPRRPRSDDDATRTPPEPTVAPRQPAPALLDDEPRPAPRKPRVDLLDEPGGDTRDKRQPKVDLLEDDRSRTAPAKPRVELLD